MRPLHLILSVVLHLSIAGAVQSRDNEGSSLRAGSAAVEISPTTLPALRNGGFLQASSDRVDDPLHARCLALNDGAQTIAIVIVDSCMFPRTLCDEIKRLATERTGIPTDRILISATHTHSAPSAEDLCLGCGRDESYVKFVPAGVAQAIADAQADLRPAKIGWTAVDGSDFTSCRRWITRSDRMGSDPFGRRTVRAMMHPGYQNLSYVSPAGPIDPWLSILSVVSAKDNTPICVMANLSMHYFGAGAGFSADYFGEVARLLEARIGKISGTQAPDVVGIMSQGTSGDQHWMDYSKPRRGINRQQYAEGVADRVLEAWKTIRHRQNVPLAMAEKRLTIRRRIPSTERLEWAGPINRNRGDIPPRNQVEVYAQQAEWIDQHPDTEVVLQAVRIGELGITAIPNEVFGITGLKLKRQSPLAVTFNLELANGGAGYIPPPEQHRLGGYTTWPARSAGLEEQAEPQIVKTLLQLLESVSEQQRKTLTDPASDYSDAVTNRSPVAYWRLGDMYSTQVRDAAGQNHAEYKGGVALFLPGPDGSGLATSGYGNRCVYLAGGHLEGHLPEPAKDYTVSMWFWNGLPTAARDVTGTLLLVDGNVLQIAGRADGDQAGRLVVRTETASRFGRTPVATKGWHHVSITRTAQRLRVYLDGRGEPEIDAQTRQADVSEKILVGSEGNSATTFDGKIDEIAVFDRAFTAIDIADLYTVSEMTPPPRPKPTVLLGPKPSDADALKKYAQAVMTSKPIAYWRLHEKSAQSAEDVTGRFPATYEEGASPLPPGTAHSNFTGGRVRADVPQLGNTYSIELWVRNELPNNSRPVTCYLFSRGITGAEGAPGDNLGIGGTHMNSGRLFVFNGNQQDQSVVGMTQIEPGSWSHVVMVRQNQKITVYLNGDPKPEIEGDLPITWPTECADMLLGGRNDNFANLQGMLEEIAVYDRVLTPDEVQAHFAAAAVKPVEKRAVSQTNATDTPKPTEVARALETIHVRDGFEVQLVAAEPLVKDPVAIDWGPDGKLWVVEMADYPLGIDGKAKPGGRIRFLEDTNNDGQYDKSTLFAEGLSFPNGVLTWGNGILVTAAPDITYMEDSTGDGQADVRRILYSGFLEGNQQLRVNGLRSGLDNRVYCASGSHHAGYGKENRIVSHLTGREHQIGSRDFCIRPDTGEIDAQSGPSQYGRNRDDWGNWFGVQNSHPLWHYVLADHNIRRNSHYAPPDPKQQVITPTNPPVYPASKRQKRFHSFEQSGRFTSACSAMIYRDELLFERGPDQHAFTCEPFHNLVQHNIITSNGVSFRSRRDPAESELDFFASEDRWCRPVMVRTGPDGALWIVDMYRYMIEHPQWLPKTGQDELRPWYRSGENRGRIYRIVRSDRTVQPVAKLDSLSPEDLVGTLENTNGWHRDTAQRLIVRNRQNASVELLRTVAIGSKRSFARLHAIWTLDGLGALDRSTLEAALTDRHAGVRRNAVRLAAGADVDVDNLVQLVDDPDAKVRLELASTLGACNDETASKALADLALRSTDEPYITSAVMSSLTPLNAATVLRRVVNSTDSKSQPLVLDLIRQTVAMGDADAISEVIRIACTVSSTGANAWRHNALAQTLDGLARRRWRVDRLSETHRDQIAMTIQDARVAAATQTQADDLRSSSVQLLAREADRLSADFQLMEQLLVPQSPVAVQRAVVQRLAERSELDVAEILLSGWRSHSPLLRNEILSVLPTRRPWVEFLRQKLESGTVQVSELSAAVRQRLLVAGGNTSVWKQVLAVRSSANRADTLLSFRPALTLTGDPMRGAALFRKLCSNCHKVKDEGHEVGPNLASITNKTKESLLTSILDPNVAVDAKYFSYVAVTQSGRSFNGIMATETGSSITLLAAEGKRQSILRSDIDELQASSKSLMPEGLEKDLTPQDLADMISFIRDKFSLH
ncbi:MAG: c-type cytochrome [Fuerstiella sp.]|nr:c-type cytochrome [Fuerstiella sp.]